MELWQLRTFCVIADTLNFTKASERLNLTQSAVSHQIKSLEDELGVKLFVRGKRGVKLTDAGRSAVESSRRILDEAELMRQQVAGREQALAAASAWPPRHRLWSICSHRFSKISWIRTTASSSVSHDREHRANHRGCPGRCRGRRICIDGGVFADARGHRTFLG